MENERIERPFHYINFARIGKMIWNKIECFQNMAHKETNAKDVGKKEEIQNSTRKGTIMGATLVIECRIVRMDYD